MTSTPTVVRLVSPRDVLDSIPHTLGFRPHDSLVVVLLRTWENHRRRTVLTMRFDLVGAGLPGPEAVDWDSIRSAVRASGATSSLMAVFATAEPAGFSEQWERALDKGIADVADESAPMEAIRSWLVAGCVADEQGELMRTVGEVLDGEGAPLTDVLVLAEGRYFSLMCDDDSCCPTLGTPYDAEHPGAVGTAFAVEGSSSPFGDRSFVVQRFARDPEGHGRLAEAVDVRDQQPTTLEVAERSACIDEVLLAAGEFRGSLALDAEREVRVLLLLMDVHVRDGVLAAACGMAKHTSADGDRECFDERSAVDEPEEVLRSYLTTLVRWAPDALLAAPATMAAILWWIQGDGACANVALDRVLAISPDYRLARLTEQIIRAAVPPPEVRRLIACAG